MKHHRDSAGGRAYLDLQNLARREKRNHQELLTLFAVERWLARLAVSEYADDLILKGGVLMAVYGHRRATQDADLMGRGLQRDQEEVRRIVAAVARVPLEPDDGLRFSAEEMRLEAIRESARYQGTRVKMPADLDGARILLRLDINFGDPITPGPRDVALPALRPDDPDITVLGYPLETMMAEKLVTAMELGEISTRVRDWADLYVLIRTQEFSSTPLMEAIHATAAYRDVTVTRLGPTASLLAERARPPYRAFRNRLGTTTNPLPSEFTVVTAAVASFCDRLLETTRDTTWHPLPGEWA